MKNIKSIISLLLTYALPLLYQVPAFATPEPLFAQDLLIWGESAPRANMEHVNVTRDAGSERVFPICRSKNSFDRDIGYVNSSNHCKTRSYHDPRTENLLAVGQYERLWRPNTVSATWVNVSSTGADLDALDPVYGTEKSLYGRKLYLCRSDRAMGFVKRGRCYLINSKVSVPVYQILLQMRQLKVDPFLSLGSHHVGEFSYSTDDLFKKIGGTKNVDLRAVVRYPAKSAGNLTRVATGKHPIIIMQHGNHTSCRDTNPRSYTHDSCVNRVPSHEGYMGLLNKLASYGFIAVSVDAYDLTGLVNITNNITEKGLLNIKHLEFWTHLNDSRKYADYVDPTGGLFRGSINLQDTVIAGHSRGAEAAVKTLQFSLQKEYRNDAVNIVAVSAIEPTNYENVQIENNIPFQLILGAADGDVTDMVGLSIYDDYKVGKTGSKLGSYIHGANHNFFNTIWAADKDDSESSRPDYIDADKQQMIGETLIASFALRHVSKTHNDDKKILDDFLKGIKTSATQRVYKIYPFFRDGGGGKIIKIADYTALPVAALKPFFTTKLPHTKQRLQAFFGAPQSRLWYDVPTPMNTPTPLKGISFPASKLKTSRENDNWSIILFDLKGNRTSVNLLNYIPNLYERPDGKSRSVMTQVYIPRKALTVVNKNFDPDIILKFILGNGLHQDYLYLDDIKFIYY